MGDWDPPVRALRSEGQDVGTPGFLARACLDAGIPRTSQALASFKRQQEEGFREQSALAVEARRTRRQELLEKIAEGQAAKKQRLEQESGTSESQEDSGNQAEGENEASTSQASGEHEHAGGGGS